MPSRLKASSAAYATWESDNGLRSLQRARVAPLKLAISLSCRDPTRELPWLGFFQSTQLVVCIDKGCSEQGKQYTQKLLLPKGEDHTPVLVAHTRARRAHQSVIRWRLSSGLPRYLSANPVRPWRAVSASASVVSCAASAARSSTPCTVWKHSKLR